MYKISVMCVGSGKEEPEKTPEQCSSGLMSIWLRFLPNTKWWELLCFVYLEWDLLNLLHAMDNNHCYPMSVLLFNNLRARLFLLSYKFHYFRFLLICQCHLTYQIIEMNGPKKISEGCLLQITTVNNVTKEKCHCRTKVPIIDRWQMLILWKPCTPEILTYCLLGL